MQCPALLAPRRRSPVRFQALGGGPFCALRGLCQGSSFFLPQFKDTSIGLVGNSKLPGGVKIVDSQVHSRPWSCLIFYPPTNNAFHFCIVFISHFWLPSYPLQVSGYLERALLHAATILISSMTTTPQPKKKRKGLGDSYPVCNGFILRCVR